MALIRSNQAGRLANRAVFCAVLPLAQLAALFAQPRSIQEPPRTERATPTIQVEVSLVNLTATVIDRAGHPVPRLKKDDFLVYEDGVPQGIAVFRNDEDLPVSVGIAFDTSGSMVDKIDDVRDAVIHLVNTINAADDVFIMQFSTGTLLVQDFTADRRQLRGAVERLRAAGSTSLYDAVISGLQHLRSGRHRRKALVLITDGNDTSSKIDLQQAVDLAIRSEVPLYCLGIGHGGRGSFGHREGNFKDTVDADALRTFSNVTGGRTFVLQGAHHKHGVDQIDQACQQVAAELRQQYTLGYYPSNTKSARVYRRIQVKVKRGNFRVRARDGYFASPAASTTARP